MENSKQKENLEINIRMARSEDAETIVNFQIACAMETESVRLSPRTVEAGVLRIISFMGISSVQGLGEYIVVQNEDSDEVIACCLLQNQFSDWHCGYYAMVESVYVHPDYRGCGVLQKMYAYVEDLVLRSGQVHEMRSTVSFENETMHKALKKMNWHETKYKVFGKEPKDLIPTERPKEIWSKGKKYYP